MTHTTPPSLNTNDWVTLVEDAELDGLGYTPLQTLVDILLPRSLVEVGLGFREHEWIYTAVQMAVTGGACVAGDHEDRADGTVLGDEAGGGATAIMLARRLRNSRLVAYLVVRTRIAPAFCSRLADTAAMAQVSVVGTGRGARLRSSSKALTYGIATSASKQVSCMRVTASLG